MKGQLKILVKAMTSEQKSIKDAETIRKSKKKSNNK